MAATEDEDVEQPFSIKRSCIATVPQDEQNEELYNLGIDIYDQEALEKGIILQITGAYGEEPVNEIIHLPEEYWQQKKKLAVRRKKPAVENTEAKIPKGDDVKKSKCTGSDDGELAQIETERKVRMGEITPFGSSISLAQTEKSKCTSSDDVGELAQTETERKVRMDEITPFGSSISLAQTEKSKCTSSDDVGELAQTETERKVRMDEITPCGSSISLAQTEDKCYSKVAEYLQEHIEADKRRKELKKKLSVVTKTVKVDISKTQKKEPQPKKNKTPPPKKARKKKSALGTYISEDVNDQTKKPGKALSETTALEDSSEGECVPTEPEFSDTEAEIQIPPPKKRRKSISSKTTDDGESYTDDSEWVYSDDEIQNKKSKSAQREQDDGDMDRYLWRLSAWEKRNNREEIETECETLEEGFKVPLSIWNNLFKYQKTGVQWLWELHMQRCGGILGDEMGLGKTVQVIALLAGLSVSKLRSHQGSYKGLGPVLIVCPTTVMHQWVKELHTWWPQFRVALLHESGNYTGKRSNLIRDVVKTKGILVTSYVSCVQQRDRLTNYLWHYVILDEGHKIRNPDSQIANAVKMFRTPHRLILSGSPMQNNLKELWSLIDFTFPGKLGTLPVFMAEFAVPITQGGYANASQVQVATAFKCATVLRDTISPYLLRRVKEDVKSHINLPLKNEQVLFCKLTDEQKSLYLQYINSAEVDSIISGKYKIFVGLINLRKICNHPDLFTGGPKVSDSDDDAEENKYGYWKKSGKMIVVETLLKIWKKQDHKVLIFTQSRQMLNILENFVQSQGYTYLKLDGSTCIKSRQPVISKFNEDSNYFVFLATTRVGGLGINLTGADRVVIYDPDWNPATDTQARERAWRIGQKNQVTIYRLVTSGTIEEKIYHRQIFKQFLTNKVLKNPRQRRFFKSNDLYELFTFKDTEGNTTETSALFAGSGSEVNLDNISRRMKSSKRSRTERITDPSSLFHPEKVREMRKLAKMLSERFKGKTGASSKDSDAHEPEMTSDSSNQASLNTNLDEDTETENSLMRSEYEEEDEEYERKKRKINYEKFEGERVPHLMSRLEYKECDTRENEHRQEQDDYILGKLFSKSEIKSAMQHDRIMEEGPADYALVEGEAEKVAKEAVRALKESRKQYFQSLDNIPVRTKPRFGSKSRKKPGQRSSDSAGEGMSKKMTSIELLSRMKNRNRLLNDDANITIDRTEEEEELLTDIRNFISHEAEEPGRATTQEIIDAFRDRLPTGTSPLFRALLKEICDFHRNSEGIGIWSLKYEFQWKIMDASKDEEDSFSEFSFGPGDCGIDACVKGPPFDPRDYMVSPSESSGVSAKGSATPVKKKLRPADLKFDGNALNARHALVKLQGLLSDKFSRRYVERQRNLVRAVVTGMSNGFFMEDITPVIEITEHFAHNYERVPEYFEMLKMILEVAVIPPRITKSSDALNCKKELSDYFTLFGELLAVFGEENAIQCRLLEILNVLLIRPAPADLTCIKLPYCHASMEDSLLPYTVASMLETVSDKLYLKYLDVALHMVLASKKACVVMMMSGAIEFVLWRLDPHHGLREKHVPPVDAPYNVGEARNESENYDVLDTAGHLMWIFLSTLSDFNVRCSSPTQKALWCLRYALHAETRKGTSKAIATRNNLAGIVVKLYSVFGDKLPILESGLAVDISMLSVATEIGTANTWAEDISFGASKADYALKKMMLICCCELAKDDSMSEILREQKVIEGILHLINPGLTSLSVPWMPSQFLNLLLLGLTVLSELVPVLPDVYVANKGNTRLLMCLEWFMEEHFDKLPLLETLKTLCALVSCENNHAIIADLKEQHGSKTLLNLCFYILESPSLKQDDQEKLTRIFIILEKLCGNETKIKPCLGSMYIAVSIKFLRRAVKNYECDSKLDPGLLISFSGFLWEAVAWCPTLLRSFSEQKGIYLLLDLVEMSSYPVQIVFLGLLVDMTDEGETLTHLLTWRDENGYGLLNTMIKIWKKEEILNKVPRTQTGCIADVDRPLMSEEQWYLTNCVKNAHMFSPSIAEMVATARPKIHSLYQLFRQRYKDVTQLNESLYCMSFSVVQPEYQVYIPLIEHFLILKMGEIWFEVYRDVVFSGVVPMACDGETIATLLEEKNRWCHRLKTMQEEIINFQKLNASDNEGKLYQLIRSCSLAAALDALHELDFIARTSYKDIQIIKKGNQLKEIDCSLNVPHGIDDTHIHRTAVRGTNVTYLCGKYVWFKSEREVLPESNLVEPVSPNSLSCNEFSDS